MSTIANERDAAIEHSVTVEMMNSHLQREIDEIWVFNKIKPEIRFSLNLFILNQ